MNSEATEFTKKHLRLGGEQDIEAVTVPFERVVQLIETFHASKSKNIGINHPILFLNNKEIDSYATQEVIEKAIPQKRNSTEAFLIKIGFEIGAVWMRDLIKKNSSCQK